MSSNVNNRICRLPQFTDCDNLTLICSSGFTNIVNTDWNCEIQGFQKLFDNAKHHFKRGYYSKDEFTDVLSVTGVEIDGRSFMMKLAENFMEVFLIKLMRVTRNFPGMKDMEKKDFIKVFFENRFYVSLVMNLGMTDLKYLSEFNVKDESIKLTDIDIANLNGETINELQKDSFKRLNRLKLTPEEIMLILGINLTGSKKEFPFLKLVNNRLLACLQRYLENTYGEKFHLRMIEIVNVVSCLRAQETRIRNYWRNNIEYLNHLYTNKLIFSLWGFEDIQSIVEMIEDMKII